MFSSVRRAFAVSLYRMPVEIGITLPASTSNNVRGATGPVTQTVKLTVEQQHNVLNVPLDSAPTDVRLDPNTWLPMMQATFVRR